MELAKDAKGLGCAFFLPLMTLMGTDDWGADFVCHKKARGVSDLVFGFLDVGL